MLGYEDIIFKNTLFSADSAEGSGTNTETGDVGSDKTYEEITDERLDKIEEQLGIGKENDAPAPEENTESSIGWYPDQFGEAAGSMGVGMLGVFLIVGIIMGATYAINAIISRISNRKKDAE